MKNLVYAIFILTMWACGRGTGGEDKAVAPAIKPTVSGEARIPDVDLKALISLRDEMMEFCSVDYGTGMADKACRAAAYTYGTKLAAHLPLSEAEKSMLIIEIYEKNGALPANIVGIIETAMRSQGGGKPLYDK
jgi:hypothetical protein